MGHDHAQVSDVSEPVENDDYAAFVVSFGGASGALEVSRVAAGHANSLTFEVFCENGSATFDQRRPAEIGLLLGGDPARNGFRQVILGPQHPYLAGRLAMDAPSVGFGQNDAFAYQGGRVGRATDVANRTPAAGADRSRRGSRLGGRGRRRGHGRGPGSLTRCPWPRLATALESLSAGR